MSQKKKKKKKKNGELNEEKASRFSNRQTTLETNVFETIAFLLEIQLAVGLFLLLLFISISN